MFANLSEHDIFAKANALICELTNKSAATLGDRKSLTSRQETGFIFVIQVKDVFIQEIQVSRSYF